MLGPNGQVIDTGELLVKSRQLMAKYMDNVDATDDAFDQEGYMRTGDVGYQDADGRIFLVDRAKDLIKVNGWYVFKDKYSNWRSADTITGKCLLQSCRTSLLAAH